VSHIKAVRQVLTSSSAVTALMGQRFFPELLPQNVAMPAAVLTLVSDVPNDVLAPAPGSTLFNARVQVDVYDKDFDVAEGAAKAIRDALGAKRSSTFSATQVDRRHFFERETNLYRVSLDFSVWRGDS
jgi:hypothetical protein